MWERDYQQEEYLPINLTGRCIYLLRYTHDTYIKHYRHHPNTCSSINSRTEFFTNMHTILNQFGRDIWTQLTFSCSINTFSITSSNTSSLNFPETANGCIHFHTMCPILELAKKFETFSHPTTKYISTPAHTNKIAQPIILFFNCKNIINHTLWAFKIKHNKQDKLIVLKPWYLTGIVLDMAYKRSVGKSISLASGGYSCSTLIPRCFYTMQFIERIRIPYGIRYNLI